MLLSFREKAAASRYRDIRPPLRVLPPELPTLSFPLASIAFFALGVKLSTEVDPERKNARGHQGKARRILARVD